MYMYCNKVQVIIPTSDVSYKIFRFSIKKIEKQTSNNDSIDLALRSDNVLLMSPFNVILICTARLTDGASTVDNYIPINYDNCFGTCFHVELNVNINIMALAVWYKNTKASEVNETICTNRIIKLRIFTSINYSKQICNDSFMREDNYNINMLYTNCNQENKVQTLFITMNMTNVNVVEIALYNKWSIEHLPLKCVHNKSVKDSTIKSKNLQIIPWNLIVDAIRHDDNRPIDKSSKDSNKVSKGITDNNIFTCFVFNFNKRIVLFTFEFKVIVLMKSITFITGLSLENNALFIINQYSNNPDSPYQNLLDNINECNTKLVKDKPISYNG